MSNEPGILVWNYTLEEKKKLDLLLEEIGAPSAMTIESSQGHLTLREIIHANTRSDRELASQEKVILFYNIPQKGVFFLINRFKETDLPRPMYAVVTEHSIEWPFRDLLEHLVSERDKADKRSDRSSEE